MARRNEPIKPERVIALLSGDSGTGKSFFIANLKNALIFDTDIGGGLAYADERIRRNGSERIEVGSYPEVIQEINNRRGQMNKITTLAIDHLTTLQAEAVLRYNPSFSGKTFGKEYDKARKEWQKIRDLVRWGDFHLFCTAHLKTKYEGTEDDRKAVGMTADAAKNIEADFMQYLQLKARGPDQYPSTAYKIKWRRDPDDPRGKVPASFPFTLEKFVELHGFPLEGEREEVALVSVEQLQELEHLMSVLKLDEDWSEKQLTRAKVDAWSEMPAAMAQKAIDFLKDRLAPNLDQLKNPSAA